LRSNDLTGLKKELMQFAVNNNLEITRISEDVRSLEAVFRELTIRADGIN
jgi:hypothetical protein